MKRKLFGAAARMLVCPEHGAYKGAVLFIGEKHFPARCPSCRALDLDKWREAAFYALGRLGEARMANQRRRRETDREYFVRLHDEKSSAKVAVGKFWASSDAEAIEMAKNEYPGLFDGMETRTWIAKAEPTGRKASELRSVNG